MFSLDVGSQASSSTVCPGQEKAGTTGFQEWAKNEEVELWGLSNSWPGFYFALAVSLAEIFNSAELQEQTKE